MADATSQFVDFMRSCGIGPHDPSDIVADDQNRRYRVDGDPAKTRNGTYQLREAPDGFAVGYARSYKQGITHKWHTKASRQATPEERDEWKRRADDARKEQARQLADLAEKAAIKAAYIWDNAARTGGNEYMTRKGIDKLHGARIWRDMVIVPMRIAGRITGLQFIRADGSKRFLAGGTKEGAYHAMADKGESLARIVVAEGYATAVKLREALGLPVIVAFDAGNLKPVAVAIKAKNPDSELIFAADNDQWTDKPMVNPGLHWAQQAAVAVGGAKVILPQFPADDPERRTDWDDVARSQGLDAIRAAFAVPEPEPAPEYEPEPMPMPDHVPEILIEDDDPLDVIRPLGHNNGEYVFFPRESAQIVKLTASAFGRIQSLYRLAPRSWWERQYSPDGKTSDSAICALASANLMEACHKAGVYSDDNTRGVGAWIDNKIAVINCGTVVIASDGRRAKPALFKGEYIYESGPSFLKLDVDPATNKEAARFLDLCKMLKFKRPQYGVLLAGWAVIAPIGGALNWKPHIWLTGRAGSGKSWVLKNVICPALGRTVIRRGGGTSEAGIRKALGRSSRPYALDEAESQNGQRAIETEKILALLRGSSSGDVLENAYATYQSHSCFALAAIIPRIEQQADVERITILELLKPSGANQAADFAAIEDAAHTLLTSEYADALLSRTIANIETLLKNVQTFTRAAAAEFVNKRSGDQLGPMLAGAYSLTSTKVISPSAAREWIAKQNWDWHTESYEESDAKKLVTLIMSKRVQYDHAGMSRQATIGDLVENMSEPSHPSYSEAKKALGSYGIAVKDGYLLISNSAPNLRTLLKDTQYIPWDRTLQDFPGAHNAENKPVYFAPGVTSKARALPLIEVMGIGNNAVEMPIDAEDFR